MATGPAVFPPTTYYSPPPHSALEGLAPQSVLSRTATEITLIRTSFKVLYSGVSTSETFTT